MFVYISLILALTTGTTTGTMLMAQTTFKTHPQVIALKTTGKRYEAYRDTGERGKGRLGVEVSSTGTKRWLYRYFIQGKRQFIRLGFVSDDYVMTMAEDNCKEFADWLSQGRDPKQVIEERDTREQVEREAKAKKGSIEQLFKAYTDQMKADGKRTYEAVLKSLEKEVYTIIPKETKANQVEAQAISDVLSVMIDRGAGVQSNRVRSYMVAAFNYGLKHDLNPEQSYTGLKFGLSINPAQSVPRKGNAEKVGENWLPINEVIEVLAAISDVDRVGAGTSALLKLCFHTGGQRPYELIASRWESINWEAQTLLIASDVSKNKREHLVPLTDSAIGILKALESDSKESPFIFPKSTNKNEHLRTDSFSKAIARYREAYPEAKAFVARDIRRTCKTLMGELGVSKELRDRLQNHALNDVSSKHYDRYDYLPEKREALRKWEAKLIDKEATVISAEFGGVKHG